MTRRANQFAPGGGVRGFHRALALSVALAAALPSAAQSKRSRAESAYERAVQLRTELEARPPASRAVKDYETVIAQFKLVYHIDPGYPRTPVALVDAAELYEEMGRRFSNDRYYGNSIDAYRFVIAQYPGSSIGRDALYTIGEIYRLDLEDPDNARLTFQQFLDRYPHGAKSPEAAARLEQIDQLLSERARTRAKTVHESAARLPTPSSASRDAGEHRPGRYPEVSDIRHWEGPNYTRIVIGVQDEVKFDASRLRHPDRIVFDLPNTRLSQELAGKTFPVEDGFLQQIRVAQFKPSVTRVVLDIRNLEDYSVFSLPNPFRLVIDVHGPAKPAITETLARTKPRKPPEGRATARTTASSAARHELPREETAELRPSAAPPSALGNSSNTTTPQGSVSELKPSPPVTDTGEETSVSPAVSTGAGSTTLTRALGLKIARIVIDPGHGGHDTGTIGPTGLREKDVVLDVALRLRKLILQRMGSEVVMTRDDDTFIPLEERTAIANEKDADLFISIHANASRDREARGIETYYLNFTTDPRSLAVAARENATSQESVHELQSLIKKIALTEKIKESQQFALDVQRSVYQATNRAAGGREENRGLKKAPFIVLIGANMPSVLAEISFLTNPQDERLLRKPEYRQKVAEALYRGIAQYTQNLGTLRLAERSRAPITRVSERQRSGRQPAAAAPTASPDSDPSDF